MSKVGPKRACAVLIVPMALSLLGASAPASEAPPPINACALLTDADVAEVLKMATSPGQRQDSGLAEAGAMVSVQTYSSTCLWRVGAAGTQPDPSASLRGASYVILSALQWPVGSGEAKGFLQSFRDAAAEGVIHQAPVTLDIADGALWWGDGVAVYRGDRSFGVSVHVGEHASQRAVEEALARKAATRL